MPIKTALPLPAIKTLEAENIFVMSDDRAVAQDIRPLKILILNLMPTKIETETQLLRLLGNTPLQVEVDLMGTETYTSKNTAPEHLLAFYRTFSQLRDNKYDGMIITGAPVEHLAFEEVFYWEELCQIMAWSKSHVYSTFYMCWAAWAGLYYHYDIPKHALPEKMFGVFKHYALIPNHPLLRGFDDAFYVPHSRYAETRREDIEKNPELDLLTCSDMSGVHIVADRDCRQFFVTGHSEYDRDTLAREYFRDTKKGRNIQPPFHYFPYDNPNANPALTWRAHAQLLLSNLLNYVVYQRTPYDLAMM